jgi:hypothetical protein
VQDITLRPLEIMMPSTPDLSWFDTSVQLLSAQIPFPVVTCNQGRAVHRFQSGGIQSAIFLITARYVSGLHASEILLERGFLQELGAVRRTLSDFAEDAAFLSLGLIKNDKDTKLDDYLSRFWAEEPEFHEFSLKPSMRSSERRQDIKNYLDRFANDGASDYVGLTASKYLYRLFSGYIHGSAPALMDMFNPHNKKFEVTGTTYAHYLETHRLSFEVELSKGVALMLIVARALDNGQIMEEANEILKLLGQK